MIDKPIIPYKEIREYKAFERSASFWHCKKRRPRKVRLLEFIEYVGKNKIEEASYPADAPLAEQPTKWQSIKEFFLRKEFNFLHLILLLYVAGWAHIESLSRNIMAIIVIIGGCFLIDFIEIIAFKDLKRFFKPKPKEIQNGN